jgi:hypothetical protein
MFDPLRGWSVGDCGDPATGLLKGATKNDDGYCLLN